MGISLCVREILSKAERISIRRSRFIILRSIVRLRRDLAKTLGFNAVLSVDGPVVTWLSRGALADADRALEEAREIGQAATLMFACSSCV